MGKRRETRLRRETRPRLVDDWVNHPPSGAMLWCQPNPLPRISGAEGGVERQTPAANVIPVGEATDEGGPLSPYGGASESPVPKRPFRRPGSSIQDDHSS